MTIHQETALGLVAGGLGFTILPESVSRLEPTGVTVLLISTDPTSSMLVATDPHRASVPRSATIFRTCLHKAASAARTRRG